MIKVLGISGSLRRASTNTGLLRCVAQNLPEGVQFEMADISDVPLYNGDMEKPASVARVVAQIAAADALVLACPEYNYSIAPALKNVLDWASREPDNAPLGGKPVAIMGSGGGMGSGRAQYHLRQVCVYLDLHPLNRPEVFGRAFGGEFDADGNVTDEKLKHKIAEQMLALKAWTEKLR